LAYIIFIKDGNEPDLAFITQIINIWKCSELVSENNLIDHFIERGADQLTV
jgi:hypothetical protein